MFTARLIRLASFCAFGFALLVPMPVHAQASASPSAASAAAQAGASDDAALQLAEPDFRVLNLPSTLRLPRNGSNFQLTHRFNGNLKDGSFSDQASNLFGMDQGAIVGFEYRFGIMRGVQAAVYRTGLDKAVQFYGKFDAVRQSDDSPVSVSALVSVEGIDNFQDHYSPAISAVVSRTVGDRLALYVTPVWVHNTAVFAGLDRDTVVVGVGGRVRVSSTVYVVGEVAPRAAGYDPDEPAYGFGVEKRAGGHLFQLNFTNSQGTTFGQIARGGVPDTLYLGFNLARKFF
jgi:hypothetical protein